MTTVARRLAQWLRANWVLAAIIALCTLIEATLAGSDAGLAGPARLRNEAYEYAGFWPGLLRNWAPNYAAQPYLMFVTYGFLHAGIGHLAFNMVSLWSFGQVVVRRVGNRGFALLYLASLIGGAAGFGLFAAPASLMVGASGAIFGIVGGVLAWSYVDRYTFNDGLWPVARAALILAGMNLLLWWAMNGQLAWQTHLGGFMIGWITAILIDPRARDVDT